MPNNLVKFIYVPGTATSAQIANFDINTIYFIAGTHQIYKGSTLYDGGSSTTTADLTLLREQIGSLPVSNEYDDLIDYIDKQIAAGDVANSAEVTTLENSLSNVAKSGNAADVLITDSAGNFVSTNVENALNELYTAIGTGGTNSAVTVTKTAGGANDSYAYRYTFSQGGSTITNGIIDIAKDMVATNGELIRPTVQNPITINNQQITSGTYIAMTIANGDTFYINVADLIEYNSVSNTTEITLTDTNHTITATVGEIAASKIIYQAANGGNAAVTVAQKLNSLESAIGTGIAALDADIDATLGVGDTDTEAVAVVTGVTEVDGIITSVDSTAADAAGAATRAKNIVIGTQNDTKTANTVYGAKAYADDAINTALTWGSLS